MKNFNIMGVAEKGGGDLDSLRISRGGLAKKRGSVFEEG